MATWYQFQVELDPEFKDSEFTVFSVWGNGGPGLDIWGWPTTTPMDIDGPFTDSADRVFIVVKLNQAGHLDCDTFALVARVTLESGEETVFAHRHERP